MNVNNELKQQSRRDFFTSSASGLGGVALASLLQGDGVLRGDEANPLTPKFGHFAPKAKRCVFVFLAGAPSHVDLYDPKPVLQERHGQGLPKELTDKVRFAFIKKETMSLFTLSIICLNKLNDSNL